MRRREIVLALIAFLSILYYFLGKYYHFETKKNFSENPADSRMKNNGSKRLVLYWDRAWRNENSWPWEGTVIGNCVVTYNRELIAQARAVVFHYSVLHPKHLPWKHYR